ncbi:MAG: tetratricopeptide repeat protein [Candidatus Helarchaeota archaeon]
MNIKEIYEDGISKFKLQDFAGAENLFKKGLEIAIANNNTQWLLKIYAELGKCNYFQSKLDDALKNYDLSLELAEKLDNIEYRIKNMYNKALIFQKKSDYVKTIQLLKDALKLAQEFEDYEKYNTIKTTFDDIVLKYSKILYDSEIMGNDAIAKGDYEKAIINFEKGIQAARKVKEYEALHRMLIRMSDIYLKKLNRKKIALQYLEEDLQLQKEQFNDPESISKTEIIIAQLKIEFKESEDAIKYLEDVIKLYKELGDSRGQLLAYNLFATAYFTLKNYNLALKYLNFAESLIPYVEDHVIKLQTFLLRGQVLIEIGDFEKASKNFNDALLISDEIMNLSLLGNVYQNIGKLYRLWKKFNLAHEYYSKSIEIFEKEKDEFNKVISYLGDALTYESEEDFYNAIKNFEKCIKFGEKINDLELLSNVYKELAKIYESKKDYKNATLILEKLAAVQNELGFFDFAEKVYQKIDLLQKKI